VGQLVELSKNGPSHSLQPRIYVLGLKGFGGRPCISGKPWGPNPLRPTLNPDLSSAAQQQLMSFVNTKMFAKMTGFVQC